MKSQNPPRRRFGRDEKLAADLAVLRYGYTKRGQVQIEAKEEARRRLGRSPDRSDALCLALGAMRGSDRAVADLQYRNRADVGAGADGDGLDLPRGAAGWARHGRPAGPGVLPGWAGASAVQHVRRAATPAAPVVIDRRSFMTAPRPELKREDDCMSTIFDPTLTAPPGDTPEERQRWLESLAPADRLAASRRWWPTAEERPWAPGPARAATAEERAELMRLPPIKRLAEARRLGVL